MAQTEDPKARFSVPRPSEVKMESEDSFAVNYDFEDRFSGREQIKIKIDNWDEGDLNTNAVDNIQVNLLTGSSLTMRPTENPIHVHVHNNFSGVNLHLDPEATRDMLKGDPAALLRHLARAQVGQLPQTQSQRVRRCSSLPDLVPEVDPRPAYFQVDGAYQAKRRPNRTVTEISANVVKGQTIIEVTQYKKDVRPCPSLKGHTRSNSIQSYCGNYFPAFRVVITLLALAITVLLLYFLATGF